jgi:hypothetical protein
LVVLVDFQVTPKPVLDSLSPLTGVLQMVWFLPLLLWACSGPTADPVAIKSELLKNVEEIRQAQIDLLVVGDFTACGAQVHAKTAASISPHPFVLDKCWADIGWAPDTEVYGGYWVTVSGADFEAHGIGPQLGDGKPLHIVATQKTSAHGAP